MNPREKIAYEEFQQKLARARAVDAAERAELSARHEPRKIPVILRAPVARKTSTLHLTNESGPITRCRVCGTGLANRPMTWWAENSYTASPKLYRSEAGTTCGNLPNSNPRRGS